MKISMFRGRMLALTAALAVFPALAQQPGSSLSAPAERRIGRVLRARLAAATPNGFPATSFSPTLPSATTVDSGTRLRSQDPGAGDFFGSNVAVQGDLAVVGANSADGTLGAAYVFERKNGVWTQGAKLVALDRSPGSEFGENIKVDGNTIAVGAPSDRNGVGAVYIFERAGNRWTQQAKLTASDPTEFSFFADSIALNQDVVIAGADLGVVPGIGTTGAAYVFRRRGKSWRQEAKLTNVNPQPGEGFGSGTAILDGNELAIGAASAQPSGAVYFFKRIGGAWLQQSQMFPSSPEDGQFFGIDIGVSGNSMVVGAAFAAATGGAPTGAAYVYRRHGNVWTEEARLEPAATEERLFGTRVAISGSTVVAGAPFVDFALPPASGSAWVFQRMGNAWATTAKLTASDGTPDDSFGGYVAIDGKTILIGAESAPGPSGPQEGATYMFNLSK